MPLTHLQRLEAESIHIFREVVAETDKPVLLYSIGKDSAVMLHLARKAFHPALPPLPLLHVDTTWKFRDMYAMRAQVAALPGIQLLVHQNPYLSSACFRPSVFHRSVCSVLPWSKGLMPRRFASGFW